MHKARYDSNGNIILESEDGSMDASLNNVEDISVVSKTVLWSLVEEVKKEATMVLSNEVVPGSRERKTRRVPLAKKIIHESLVAGTAQYEESARDLLGELKIARGKLRNLPSQKMKDFRAFWRMMNTPLQLSGKSGKRPPTKLGLFMMDTIRFGGTFALIFSVLFVGVNYQSFFQIARAELALGTDTKTEEALQNLSRIHDQSKSDQQEKLKRESTSADILAYLPNVGPFEDRIVIPKIGKNVPIVRPAMEALMKEDWKTFETDIQSALRHGVVHYPGSARPGQPGNFFVTGHSSYYPWDEGFYKDVFARLGELEVGDTYFVYYGGDKHTYRITRKFEVKPTDVSVLDQPTDKRLATLMTCTPIGTTLRRLIVQAEEIDPETGMTMRVGQKTLDDAVTPLKRLEALPI